MLAGSLSDKMTAPDVSPTPDQLTPCCADRVSPTYRALRRDV